MIFSDSFDIKGDSKTLKIASIDWHQIPFFNISNKWSTTTQHSFYNSADKLDKSFGVHLYFQIISSSLLNIFGNFGT